MFANIQESLKSVTDDNGCVSFSMAASIAIMHNVEEQFNILYSHMWGEPVDAGELLHWLGYWYFQRGRNAPFFIFWKTQLFYILQMHNLLYFIDAQLIISHENIYSIQYTQLITITQYKK